MCIDPNGERVAILGGGFASLCAAFELSDPAEPKGYDITIYQMGWRLGGKGASGRNLDPGKHARIEEHGIHAFFGFYDNAFDIMQRCYGELGRSPEQPLPTWEKAFEMHDLVVLMDRLEGDRADGKYEPWALDFPRMPGTPGLLPRSKKRESKWHLVKRLIAYLKDHLPHHEDRHRHHVPEWAQKLLDRSHASHGAALAHAAWSCAEAMPDEADEHAAVEHHRLHGLLGQLSNWLAKESEALESGHLLRHLRILFDFLIANVRGIFGDGLLFHSTTTINGQRYTDWLAKHGGSTFLLDSPILRGFHDLIFAFPDGDIGEPGNVDAGYGLNLLLLAMGWKGSLMWKMNSGMGDVVFAPLYEVLARRGVKFRFFHRVTGLHLDESGKNFASVKISRQICLEDGPDYHPLFQVKGLPCWPDRPLYEQIVEGDELKAKKINLESFWTPWKDTGGDIELRVGKDVDHVVLGIPVGAHKFLCADLVENNADWSAMVNGLVTVQTQAFQLWFKPLLSDPQDPAKGLGWRLESPIVGSYDASEMNSWADTSQVLPTELWKPGTVGSLAYLCGPMKGPPTAPDRDRQDFPQQSIDQVRSTVVDFLERDVQPLWPNAVADAENGLGFRYEQLVGDSLQSQFIRANIDPSERYVNSFAGTSILRLKTDGSGYEELLLVGDWIDNGLNIGCIEATAISGRQAARAISGRDMYIPHEIPY
ncbi:MAG: NAD(P)-binding protein [Acidobacteriota bacterium]